MANTSTTKKTKPATKRALVKKTPTKSRATAVHSKKAASKKTTTRAAAASHAVAAPAQAFWVCDGTVLHSLPELEAALQGMAKETYAHHVTKEKHDFADWVEQVLADKGTAILLRKAKTPSSAERVIRKRIK